MSIYVDKPISLIEKKKQQWAKEREELARLGAPWSSPSPSQNTEKSLIKRNRHVSKLPNKTEIYARIKNPASRRSSLPPLSKNQYTDREMGGETSGYGSDNPNQSQEFPQTWNQLGYESSSTYQGSNWEEKSSQKFWESKDTPNWVKRGLQTDREIVVFNTSPAESPQQEDMESERPSTSYSSAQNKTYIRGQNIPLDSAELAERERKRQIALAHQEAIRQQLEERERIKREEKERRIREEQEEELRIKREQEIERQRKENELKIVKEKQEREMKRKKAIQEALETAEKEAKLEKSKLKKQNNININECGLGCVEDKVTTNKIYNDIENVTDTQKTEKRNNVQQNNTASPTVQEKEINNDLEDKQKMNETSISCIENLNNYKNTMHRPENFAVVVQTPMENLRNMQYAVLMPSLSSTSVPFAVPIFPNYETAISSARTENRILTPTQYRVKNRRVCDSSTQTDSDYCKSDSNDNQIREKFSNLDLNYDNGNRKERRSRNEDRGVEERPKWGVNRPPTRYLKQSEKDLLYQRKKSRQKREKYSSDESQTASPRIYRKKNYIEKRHTRALWRKNDGFFARNIRMYQAEIVPLETDNNTIYYKHKCECCCRCNCQKNIGKTEILKIEHHSPRLPNCVASSPGNSDEILEKLNLLHDGLTQKQEHWERSPRTPSLSSSTRNTAENN